jgi:hypothetical protein
MTCMRVYGCGWKWKFIRLLLCKSWFQFGLRASAPREHERTCTAGCIIHASQVQMNCSSSPHSIYRQSPLCQSKSKRASGAGWAASARVNYERRKLKGRASDRARNAEAARIPAHCPAPAPKWLCPLFQDAL